jgi:hypothetical protein
MVYEDRRIINKLILDLDTLYQDGYYYTDFDIGGEGHNIIILEKDREDFLDAFAIEWRKRAEQLLVKLEE